MTYTPKLEVLKMDEWHIWQAPISAWAGLIRTIGTTHARTRRSILWIANSDDTSSLGPPPRRSQKAWLEQSDLWVSADALPNQKDRNNRCAFSYTSILTGACPPAPLAFLAIRKGQNIIPSDSLEWILKGLFPPHPFPQRCSRRAVWTNNAHRYPRAYTG